MDAERQYTIAVVSGEFRCIILALLMDVLVTVQTRRWSGCIPWKENHENTNERKHEKGFEMLFFVLSPVRVFVICRFRVFPLPCFRDPFSLRTKASASTAGFAIIRADAAFATARPAGVT
jgi:hypothetical protein